MSAVDRLAPITGTAETSSTLAVGNLAAAIGALIALAILIYLIRSHRR